MLQSKKLLSHTILKPDLSLYLGKPDWASLVNSDMRFLSPGVYVVRVVTQVATARLPFHHHPNITNKRCSCHAWKLFIAAFQSD